LKRLSTIEKNPLTTNKLRKRSSRFFVAKAKPFSAKKYPGILATLYARAVYAK
jgi:hypothetical protein